MVVYKRILVQLLLFGYSYWVGGQEHTPDSAVPGNQAVPVSSTEVQDNSDEEMSAMTRLQNISSLNGFISLLHRNGNPVSSGDVVSNYTDQSGAIHISSGGRMAQPDECSPRDTTVRLTFDNSNPNIVFFPRCTKIERCGGCCASPHLECVPSYTERVSYKVIKAEQPYPGSSHLEWKGEYSTVILDRHVTCRVQCTLTPDKCGPKKEFQERQCDCRCRVYERCQPPRVWDPEVCECKCAEVLNCCRNGELCGLTFIKDTCECGIDPNIEQIISVGNLTQEAIDAYYALLNTTVLPSSETQTSSISPSSSSSTSTTSSTTTAAAETTTQTTTVANTIVQQTDPCLTAVCPNGFQAHPNAGGNCVCRRILARPRSRTNINAP